MRPIQIDILNVLKQQTDFISLPELRRQLGARYSERSIRRYLSQMVDQQLIERYGVKRGTKYKAVSKAPTSQIFSEKSIHAIKKTRRPLYERPPVTYEFEWFESYQPNRDFYIPLDIRIELSQAGKRLKNEDPAGTYAHQIFNRLLIDLSYNSSRLEGNTYSLLETQKLILEGSEAIGKLDEEKLMILNHKEAIRYLVDNASKLKINTETILTLHYLLSDGLVDTRFAGKIRDHGVRIGGSTYTPLENPVMLQKQLEAILKKAASIVDVFEQSLFLLIHLSYLQSFTDVNKRVARLSSNIPLIKNNYVPLSFNDVNKEDYSSAVISIYELLDPNPLVDLYRFSYLRSCAQYETTVKAIGYDEIRVRYRQERRSLIRTIILEKLIGKKMDEYIQTNIPRTISKNDKADFLEDLTEDLKYIDNNRIIGLGITQDDLNVWLNLRDS